MTTASIIPMPYGDCLVLRPADGPLVLLDSGTAAAYRASLRRMLRQSGRDIGLWVISHPHSDHIGGALRYVSDVEMPRCDLWCLNSFNPADMAPAPAADGTVATSAAEASRLNAAIARSGARVRTALAGDSFDIGELHIDVLSPLPADVAAANRALGMPDGDGSRATASAGSDYHTPLDDFDVLTFDEDSEPFNRASIALLITCGGRRLLWLADSVPSVVCASLRRLGYSEGNPLECDYATVAHHGSRGNTDATLAAMVRARRYIVTANAENVHCLPHKQTLARIIRSPRPDGRPIEICFPCDTPTLRTMFDDADCARHTFALRFGFTEFEL